MRVLIAALADHANVAQPGDKLNVFGAFDVIGAREFPVVLPSAIIALRIQFENVWPEDDGGKVGVLEMAIVNPDEKELLRGEVSLTIPKIPAGQRFATNHLFLLHHLAFTGPGKFAIRIRWNGEEKQRLPLDVALSPPAAPAPAS